MRNHHGIFAIALLCGAVAARADVTFTLDPSSGSIQGVPGDTVGWGFTLTSDPKSWISVVTTVLVNETNPSLGSYVDYAGLLGGPVNGVLAPGAPAWTVPFDLLNQIGAGAFSIDPLALAGAGDAGFIDLNYEIFSADPNVCPTCATGFGDLRAPFSVQATPEPSTAVFAGIAILAASLMRMHLRRLRSR